MKLKISALFWFCFLRSSARARVPLLPVSSLRVFLAPSLITGPAVINIRTHTSVRAGRLPVGSEEILHNGAHVTQHFFSFLHFFLCAYVCTRRFSFLCPLCKETKFLQFLLRSSLPNPDTHAHTQPPSWYFPLPPSTHTHTHTHTHTYAYIYIYTYIYVHK